MKTKKSTIGCAILTYNSEQYFQALYNSIDQSKIDELVIVNGGDPYTGEYIGHWIQHTENRFPSVCRNDAVEHLMRMGCEHIFLIEDDMILKDPNIFQKYIDAAQHTGLKYLQFVSTSDGSGTPGNRNPRKIIDFPNHQKIHCYQNMCNEFTYHHASVFELMGVRPYDENMRDAFDVELTYRESLEGHTTPFWYFADIPNSDDYIENNPNAVSRLQANGARERSIAQVYEYFRQKHGLHIGQIPDTSEEQLKARMKSIYSNRILPNYDVFIPCIAKDVHKLPYVVGQVKRYLTPENIYISMPQGQKPDIDLGDSVIWVEDQEILENPEELKSKITFRPNWIFQQFLKMFQNVTKNDYFLTIDADTIICRKLEMFNLNDKPCWYYGWDQWHRPYFDFMSGKFNMTRKLDHTAIGDIGLFNKKLVNRFLNENGYSSGREMLEKLGGTMTPFFHFSEFETYGNYVVNEYMYFKLNQKTLGKWLDTPGVENWTVEEISAMLMEYDGKIDTLQLHSWKI